MYSRYQFWKPHSQWGPFPAPAADATASFQANFVAITRVLVIYAYILCSQRWRSSIQLANARPGADCGSDHELLIAKFRLKLKKVGKSTRPFRYDLNQIPYDYTVEVTNRFKGLDLLDRVSEELWTEVPDTVQEAVIKTIRKKKKCKKAKWLSEEAL